MKIFPKTNKQIKKFRDYKVVNLSLYRFSQTFDRCGKILTGQGYHLCRNSSIDLMLFLKILAAMSPL